ncbi:MAG TPA: HNH endonuclease [Anaeromyxobacteraceae bacterium]|nr:HNH endonuclease [Anaeromyxobacteraceae bacterium]
MHTHALTEATRIRDQHAELLRTERTCLADLLLSIADFEQRGLHRALGYATIFQYLHRALSMSKGMAHYRMVGARLMRRFPEVEQPVRDGRLCLTTVIEVARVMTEENQAEVLPRFFGLSRQEARDVAAEIDPARVVPRRTVVSTVEPDAANVAVADPERPGVRAPKPEQSTARGGAAGSTVEPSSAIPGRGVETERTTVAPLTATVSRMHITVSREFLALLKKAKAGESHRTPGATDEQVLNLALEALIEKQAKRKASVPAKVKREVVARDEGKCQWLLPDGSVCGATARLEIDHVIPRGKGGPSTVDNCRVLCRGHNLEAARQACGDEVMSLFTRSVGSPLAREEVAGYAAAGLAARRGARRAGRMASPDGLPGPVDSRSTTWFPPAPCQPATPPST